MGIVECSDVPVADCGFFFNKSYWLSNSYSGRKYIKISVCELIW